MDTGRDHLFFLNTGNPRTMAITIPILYGLFFHDMNMSNPRGQSPIHPTYNVGPQTPDLMAYTPHSYLHIIKL